MVKMQLFREVNAMEHAIIQQIVTPIDGIYLAALYDPITNRISVTIPKILSLFLTGTEWSHQKIFPKRKSR